VTLSAIRFPACRSSRKTFGTSHRKPGSIKKRNVLTTSVLAVALLTAIEPARSEQVPKLDITPVCRGIAAHAGSPGEKGGPDLSFDRCMASELRVRGTLIRQWKRFSPASQSQCLGDTASGLSSYTDLLTCLQMSREAKQFPRHHAQ